MRKILLLLTLAAFMASCGGNEKSKQVSNQKKETVKKTEKEKPALKLEPGERVIKSYVNGQPLLVTKFEKKGDKETPVYQKEFFENGQVSKEGSMVNGKRTGAWKSYYKTGEIWSKGFYKNGLNDSTTIAYYQNGEVRYKGQFTEGMKSGTWQIFTEEGTLKEIKNYGNK